jgi:hypothetical protein
VRFDLDSDKIDDGAFYASVSIASNLKAGRKIDENTLLWWMKQSDEAQAVFFEEKQALQLALQSFVKWFGDSTYIWSNGADFDIPMVVNALSHFHIEAPWKFWNSRCVRTFKNIPGAKNIKAPNPLKHNALHDAIAQAQLVQAIQRTLIGKHSMVKA